MSAIPLNKEIMRIYKDLNLVEHLGSGVPRMLASYSKECFKFSAHFLKMTFPSAAPVSDLSDTPQDGERAKNGGKTKGGTIGGTMNDLTARQKEVLELIHIDKKLSVRELAVKLSINKSAVQSHLNQLKDKGYIIRVGGTRGHWKIRNKK